LTRKPKCLEILVSSLKDKKIDKVIGVESRGFLRDADRSELNVVSSENPTSLTTSFQLEYGTDTLEIHTDAIRKAIGTYS
jgi:adenine phosphoribosyltransferase